MGTGVSEVQDEDLPFKEIYPCDEDDLTKLCIRDLAAGEKKAASATTPTLPTPPATEAAVTCRAWRLDAEPRRHSSWGSRNIGAEPLPQNSRKFWTGRELSQMSPSAARWHFWALRLLTCSRETGTKLGRPTKGSSHCGAPPIRTFQSSSRPSQNMQSFNSPSVA